MTQNNGNQNETHHAGNGEGRADYEKPSILYREPLEAVAAVCSPGPPPAGPAKSSTLVCPEGPISS